MADNHRIVGVGNLVDNYLVESYLVDRMADTLVEARNCISGSVRQC